MVKHPVILRGYYASPNDKVAQPLLVKRLEQEFIPAVLDGVRNKSDPDTLGKIVDPDLDPDPKIAALKALRLFQAVHRTFNIVLLEAVCDQPGSPRLNPRDIVSAGFVVRRLQTGGDDEGWLLRNERVLGWNAPLDPKLDPDPHQRRPRLNAGNPHVNGKLARVFQALEPPAERVSPLFVAPPDVCTEAGRTVLYGIVPVASAERSDDAQPAEVDPDDVDKIMPEFLRTGSTDFPVPTSESLKDISSFFVQDLRLIQFGWRVFDSPQGAVLWGLLNQVNVEFGDGPWKLGDYLQGLCRAVILGETSIADVHLPDTWHRPAVALAGQIHEAAKKSLEAAITAGLPNEQRFDRPKALYRVHAFVRVRSPDGCPPQLQWSEASTPFSIVPWWESGGGPLHTIALPDIDKESVKKIKPNVAFAVPPKLAALLRDNGLKDFIDGPVNTSGIGIGWICSFSIPIITICAFIVLNIFLTLLHIVFQWLFYIKVCLPYPSKR
jgi:hypothetical protein